MTDIEKLEADLNDCDLPRDLDKAFKKLKCAIIHGQRVYWYHKEDAEYLKEWEPDASPRDNAPYSGIMVAWHDTELRGGLNDREIDHDRCVVIMDLYPVEKCYHASTYIALGRLMDSDDLVEIFAENDAK